MPDNMRVTLPNWVPETLTGTTVVSTTRRSPMIDLFDEGPDVAAKADAFTPAESAQWAAERGNQLAPARRAVRNLERPRTAANGLAWR